MLQSLEAERQVSSAEADLLALKSNLATDRLRQESTVAQLETDAADARRRAEADRKLHARAMLSDIDTGLKFVTKDAVGPYLETKTRYEGSAKDAQIVPHTGAIGS